MKKSKQPHLSVEEVRQLRLRRLRDRSFARRSAAPAPAVSRPPPERDYTYEENRMICMTCPARTLTCPVWKLLTPCNRAKALRGDPRFSCPANKLTLRPLRPLLPKPPNGKDAP